MKMVMIRGSNSERRMMPGRALNSAPSKVEGRSSGLKKYNKDLPSSNQEAKLNVNIHIK